MGSAANLLGGCGAPFGGEDALCGEVGNYAISSIGRGRESFLQSLGRMVVKGQQFEVIILGPRGLGVLHRDSTPLSVLAAALVKLDRKTRVLKGEFAPTVVSHDTKLVDEEFERLSVFLQAFTWVGDDPRTQRQKLQGYLGDVRHMYLAYLQDLAQALHGIPGRKPVVWIPFDPEFDEARIDLLNQSAISVYGSRRRSRTNDTGAADVPGRDMEIAQPDIFIQTFAAARRDCGPYYLVRAQVPSLKVSRDRSWVEIVITIDRSGMVVRTRKGFSILAPEHKKHGGKNSKLP